MRKKLFAIAAIGMLIAAMGAGAADAGSTKYFHSTVSPSTAVKSGTVLTSKATGATPNTAYYCVIAAYSTKNGGVSAPDNATLKVVKTNKKGQATCKVTYHPFKGTDNNGDGKTHGCPVSKANKKAGWKCGVAWADQATIGGLSESIAPFTPVK